MRRINYTLAFCMMLWVPRASGQQTSAGVPQQVAPTIAVKMIDLVDSTRDPAGKQYRAGLIRPVNIGNGVIIAQGSAATVVLVKNGSGWDVQLSSLVIKGQVTTVTSNPGTVIGAAGQSNVANAANAANAVLGSFGRKPNTYSPVAVVAMGERVVLTPGISLSFVLNSIPVVPEPSSAPAPVAKQPEATTAGQSAPAPVAKPSGQGASADYYCYAKYLPDWVRDSHGQLVRGSQTTHYITGVFQAAANAGGAISVAWETHIRNLLHATTDFSSICEKPLYVSTQQRVEQMEQGLKATKQELVHVDWKYTPGAEYATQRPAPAAAGLGVGVVRPSPHAATYLVYCSSLTGPDGYVTEKFEVPSFGFDAGAIQHAFHQFLHEKYSLPAEYQLAPTPCGVDMGVGAARRDITAVEANVEASAKEGKKIVKTGWKYAGPPAAAAPAYTSIYYCRASVLSGNPEPFYVSATFAGPQLMDIMAVEADFIKFVVAKYSVRGNLNGACYTDIPQRDRDLKQNVGPSVDTGWKPEGVLPIGRRGH